MNALPTQNVSTCLWFAGNAAEAIAFYVSVIPNSKIIETNYYLEGAPRPAGDVLTIRFNLNGTEYLALNGSPAFPFSMAISLVAYCDTQAEIDAVWQKLTSEGGKEVQCGWLEDKYGLSWQIVPRPYLGLLTSPDKAAAQRAFTALMDMTKLDMAALQRAFDGK